MITPTGLLPLMAIALASMAAFALHYQRRVARRPRRVRVYLHQARVAHRQTSLGACQPAPRRTHESWRMTGRR
jgi:hypothetical protein